MGVNFQSILNKIITKLEEKQASKQQVSGNDDSSDKSIFTGTFGTNVVSFLKENKEDVAKLLMELGVANADVLDKGIDEIFSMQLQDGKLVDGDEADKNSQDEIDNENTKEAKEAMDLGNIIDEVQEEQEASLAESEISEEDFAIDNENNSDESVSETKGKKSAAEKLKERRTKEEQEAAQKIIDEKNQPIEKINIDKNDIDNYSSKFRLQSDMYKDEDVLAIMDEDGDGKLSVDEKAKFDSYIKNELLDGKDKIELEDLKNVCKQIKDGKFDVDAYKNYEVPDSDKADKADEKTAADNMPASQTPSTGGAGGGGGGGNYNPGSVTPPNSDTEKLGPLDGKTAEELEQIRDDKKGDVNDASNALEDIQNNTDPDVAEKKEASEQAEKDYLDKLEEAENINEETKEEIKDNLEQIGIVEQDINNTNSQITDLHTQADMLQSDIDVKEQSIQTCDTNITTITNQITADNSQKASLESELASVPADGDDPEQNAKNAAQRQAIESQIASLDAKIAAEEQQKTALEQEKQTLEQEKAELEQQKTDIESTQIPQLEETLASKQEELEGLQEKKEELDEKVLKNPRVAPEVKEALNKSNEAKKDFESFKEQKINAAQETLKTEKANLTEVSNKYNEVKQKETTDKTNELCKPEPSSEELIAFLNTLVGMNEGQIREKIKEEFPNLPFNSGYYCSDFVTYVMAKTFGEDNVPGDLLGNYNTSQCERVRHWSQRAGLYNTDINQVKPGDAILFNNGDGEAGHIGIVTSVNPNGTVNTIEGNGVGGFVVARQNVTGMGYISYGSYMRQA